MNYVNYMDIFNGSLKIKHIFSQMYKHEFETSKI